LKEFEIIEENNIKFIKINNEKIIIPSFIKNIVVFKDILIIQDEFGDIIDIIEYKNLQETLKNIDKLLLNK
jgi:hypothetical protein